MKRTQAYLFFIIIKAGTTAFMIKGCPTCVGCVGATSPTFWSNSLYTPSSDVLEKSEHKKECSEDTCLDLEIEGKNNNENS